MMNGQNISTLLTNNQQMRDNLLQIRGEEFKPQYSQYTYKYQLN